MISSQESLVLDWIFLFRRQGHLIPNRAVIMQCSFETCMGTRYISESRTWHEVSERIDFVREQLVLTRKHQIRCKAVIAGLRLGRQKKEAQKGNSTPKIHSFQKCLVIPAAESGPFRKWGGRIILTSDGEKPKEWIPRENEFHGIPPRTWTLELWNESNHKAWPIELRMEWKITRFLISGRSNLGSAKKWPWIERCTFQNLDWILILMRGRMISL